MDHPGGLERDLPRRLGGADGEGLEEVAGVAQVWLVSCGSLSARHGSAWSLNRIAWATPH